MPSKGSRRKQSATLSKVKEKKKAYPYSRLLVLDVRRTALSLLQTCINGAHMGKAKQNQAEEMSSDHIHSPHWHGEDSEEFIKSENELIQVNWIEVTGSVNLEKFHLDSSKTYEIVYLVRFKVDAFGWHSSPITFEVTTSDGKKNRRTENLEHHKKDGDQWLEIQGGEFTVDSSNLKGKIAFSMKEVRTDWWKGGIVLEGVKIKPKHT
ncbi:hypothetical protein HPP92_005597 [Vanilla planifolia]|uniref:Uncharacterized protein n=1 Tax=Vanilla planifolia TaxID=51239 RepID=A0A835VEV1_VANPL|nr:hypothetical protein HPP92_005597 [Vanilla planifolia]